MSDPQDEAGAATDGWIEILVHLDTWMDPWMLALRLDGWCLRMVDMKVTCADGRPIPVVGTAELNIDFGQGQIPAKVIVADIRHRGILGMDVLDAWGATVDTRRGRVNLDPPGPDDEIPSSDGDGRWLGHTLHQGGGGGLPCLLEEVPYPREIGGARVTRGWEVAPRWSLDSGIEFWSGPVSGAQLAGDGPMGGGKSSGGVAQGAS